MAEPMEEDEEEVDEEKVEDIEEGSSTEYLVLRQAPARVEADGVRIFQPLIRIKYHHANKYNYCFLIHCPIPNPICSVTPSALQETKVIQLPKANT